MTIVRLGLIQKQVKVNDTFKYNQNLSLNDEITTTEMERYNKLIYIEIEIWVHRKIHPLGIINLKISLNLNVIFLINCRLKYATLWISKLYRERF